MGGKSKIEKLEKEMNKLQQVLEAASWPAVTLSRFLIPRGI